ncbi:MAG TPA: hypothetical protein VI796_07200 [Candidatus Thermoplasmatota archaeon]|nr:hypothetical protein [Candidatus Thermoplasmatota archaeon]
MDPIVAVSLALAAVWLAIVAVALLPLRGLAYRRFRWAGAGAMGLVGAVAVGLPVSPFLPSLVLVLGALAAVAAQAHI